MKSLGTRIRGLPHLSGAITLRSGRLALLLNPAYLIREALSLNSAGLRIGIDPAVKLSQQESQRLLVVDDSITTRTLLVSILETAGYDVTAAPDGQEAWERMQNDEFDLVVSDVDMPRMNGFELTESIRKWPDVANIPVILITSRDSDADKAKGLEAGADAYLVKSAFDQTDILQTVERFL